MNKGHMDKSKGGQDQGGKWGWLEWGRVVEGKWRKLYLNSNKKVKKNLHRGQTNNKKRTKAHYSRS